MRKDGAVKTHEIIKRALVKLGGSGSGNFGHKGRPGLQGGSASMRKPGGHFWQRAGQRTGYRAVRAAIKELTKTPAFPAREDQTWHYPILAGDKLKGYLVGSDAHANTVLGPWGRPRKDSMEIKLGEGKPLDAAASVKAIWATMTSEEKERWERLNGLSAKNFPVGSIDPIDMLASIIEAVTAE